MNTEEAITIRPCTSDDAAMLAELAAQTFAETFAADNTAEDLAAYLYQAYSPAILEQELTNPLSRYWLLSVGGEPAAYLKTNRGSAQTEPVEERLPQPSYEIQRIYVRAAFKRRGLGSRLMSVGIDDAREHDMRTIWLGVWEHNVSALAFYEQQGFERFGEHVFRIGNDDQTDFLLARAL